VKNELYANKAKQRQNGRAWLLGPRKIDFSRQPNKMSHPMQQDARLCEVYKRQPLDSIKNEIFKK